MRCTEKSLFLRAVFSHKRLFIYFLPLNKKKIFYCSSFIHFFLQILIYFVLFVVNVVLIWLFLFFFWFCCCVGVVCEAGAWTAEARRCHRLSSRPCRGEDCRISVFPPFSKTYISLVLTRACCLCITITQYVHMSVALFANYAFDYIILIIYCDKVSFRTQFIITTLIFFNTNNIFILNRH